MLANPMLFEKVLPIGLMVGSVEDYRPIALREALMSATKVEQEEQEPLGVLFRKATCKRK